MPGTHLPPVHVEPVKEKKDQAPHNEERDNLAPCSRASLGGKRLGAQLHSLRIAEQNACDILDAFRYTIRKSAIANGGQDGILDDKRGHGVGELRLQPAPYLDADLAFAGRHDEQDAVVEALLPDAPGAAKLVAVILNGIALQRLGDEHDKLVGV